MTNVTIPLPDDLKELAERNAEKRGISLEEFLRETVERRLKQLESPWDEDPFFKDNLAYDGPVPPDSSERHDDYIYGDED